jgi:phosphonate transport system permease protein
MSTRLADIGPAEIADARARFPDAFGGWRRDAAVAAAIALPSVYLVWSLIHFDIDRLFNASDRVWRLIRGFFVWSDMGGWAYEQIYVGIAQTLAMAFLGTLLASVVALVIAFGGARNTMPAALPRHAVRRGLDVLRGVDSLIWALVFVRAVGLGPLAGVLAIFVSDTGTLAKLYAEAIENIDRKQVEGVRATGADGARVIRFAYLPQIFPVFLSLSLYSFESSVRSATILGIVGAGGIGMVLVERFRAGLFDQVAFVVLNVLVCVAVIDWVSARIRARFIGQERA